MKATATAGQDKIAARTVRGAGGKFAKGNRSAVGHGKGRPPRSVEEKYLEAIREEVPVEEWRKAVRNILSLAATDDKYAVKAFEALAKYLAPIEALHRIILSTPDIAEEARRMSTEQLIEALQGEAVAN